MSELLSSIRKQPYSTTRTPNYRAVITSLSPGDSLWRMMKMGGSGGVWAGDAVRSNALGEGISTAGTWATQSNTVRTNAIPDADKNPFTFHRAHYLRESSCEIVALEPVLLHTALIANSFAAGGLGLRQAQPERY